MNASKFCFMVLFCGCLVGAASLFFNMLSLQGNACVSKEESITIQGFKWDEKVISQGKLYVLTLSNQAQKSLSIGIAPQLATVESPLWEEGSPKKKPVFVINGGFFDPNNAKTTSYLYKNGVMVGDPHDNRQMVENPKLEPYLEKIFNRTEFRIYQCNKTSKNGAVTYDIVKHDAPVSANCALKETLGAGPQLLPKVMSYEEGFIDFNAAHKITRDPIGVNAKNARSAVGIKANGDVIIMMGAQVPDDGKRGFSLQDMADQLKAEGAVKAMSLDGGSSSGLVYQGQVHYGKFNKDGSPVIRPVKSVLMLLDN